MAALLPSPRWTRFVCTATLLFPLFALAGVTTTPITDPGDAPAATTPAAPSGSSTVVMPSTQNLPTPADAKALLDARHYPEALRVAARLLALKGNAVTFDRPEMLILKAECDLQIHQPAPALLTLDEAQKEAHAGNFDKTEMKAMAFTDLIKKSPRTLYVPQNGEDRTPISILDRDKRRTAYNCLFTDSLAILQTRLHSVIAAETLAPMLDLARELLICRADEYMGTDGTAATTAVAKDLAAAMSRLITTALVQLDGRVTRISQSASHLVIDTLSNGTVGSQSSYHRAGLTSANITDLNDITQTCEKLRSLLTDFNKIFGTADVLRGNLNRIDVIEEHAKETRTRDYRVL